jgi:hypothetical protein
MSESSSKRQDRFRHRFNLERPALSTIVDHFRAGRVRAYATYAGDQAPGVDRRKRKLTLTYTDPDDPSFITEARYLHDEAVTARAEVCAAGIPFIDLSGAGKSGITLFMQQKLIDLAGTHPNDPMYDTLENVCSSLRRLSQVIIRNI